MTRNEFKMEALETIKETLEEGYNGYVCDLHNAVFNSDYYVVYTNKAKEILLSFEGYNIFDIIEEIKDYESFNFGEVKTDFSNTCDILNMFYILNMFWYIIGEEAVQMILDNMDEDYWNDYTKEADELNTKLLEATNKTIEEFKEEI